MRIATPGRPLLLVDDEVALLRSVSLTLRSAGTQRVETLSDSAKVMETLSGEVYGALILDLSMPGMSGEEVLGRVIATHPDLPVIILTAKSDIDSAVRCMRDGAVDYLVKPVDAARLISAVNRALEGRELREELVSVTESMLAREVPRGEALRNIVTADERMHNVFRYVEAIAPSPRPVLITGETGTGKDLLARAIHELSAREGPFVTVNVAGLDDTMFSDTLFGHRRGAFSGATAHRDGLLVSAAGGTLMLDEIGDLSIASQVKLLRLLQDGEFYPLGSDRPSYSNARIVVATSVDVAAALGDGRMRKDLYYRLQTHHVHIPPLRERTADVALLARHFVNLAADSLGRPAPELPPELEHALSVHPFPGNVRELETLLFDAVTRHRSGPLRLDVPRQPILEGDALMPDMDAAASVTGFAQPGGKLPTLKDAEQRLIEEALRRAEGNQGVAATMLGISRQALNKRLSRSRSPG